MRPCEDEIVSASCGALCRLQAVVIEQGDKAADKHGEYEGVNVISGRKIIRDAGNAFRVEKNGRCGKPTGQVAYEEEHDILFGVIKARHEIHRDIVF